VFKIRRMADFRDGSFASMLAACGDHQLPDDSRRDRLIGALACNFTPRDLWANAQAQGSDHLDHERDITLAIHAAIPDFVGKQPIATTYRLAAQITAARRCYKSKGPFDDR
jgi:hypothetical protein